MPAKARKTYAANAEVLTVRLSPKMKFGLELLSRKQHRSLSAIVQHLLDRELRENLKVTKDVGDNIEGWREEHVRLLDLVWDPYEPDRLVKLGMHSPDLLDVDEELKWKVIQDDYKRYWHSAKKPNYKAIRDDWSDISKKAEDAKFNRTGLTAKFE